MSVETVLSTHKQTHTHAHRGTHTHRPCDYTKLNVHNFNGQKQRLEVEEDGSMEQKTWQVSCFGIRDVLRFDMEEPREGCCRRLRGRSLM